MVRGQTSTELLLLIAGALLVALAAGYYTFSSANYVYERLPTPEFNGPPSTSTTSSSTPSSSDYVDVSASFTSPALVASAGTAVTLTAQVCSVVGTTDADISVEFREGSTVIGTDSIVLSPSDCTTVSTSYTFPGGTKTITVVATTTNVSDINPVNNSDTIMITESGQPDLVVSSVSAYQNRYPAPGYLLFGDYNDFVVNVTVCNVGSVAAPGATLSLSSSPVQAAFLGDMSVPPLSPGDCTTKQVSGEVLQYDKQIYITATVNLPDDADTSNNSRTTANGIYIYYECSSCTECTNDINTAANYIYSITSQGQVYQGSAIVLLTNDIHSNSPYCVYFNNVGAPVTFDGGGHTISSGTGAAIKADITTHLHIKRLNLSCTASGKSCVDIDNTLPSSTTTLHLAVPSTLLFEDVAISVSGTDAKGVYIYASMGSNPYVFRNSSIYVGNDAIGIYARYTSVELDGTTVDTTATSKEAVITEVSEITLKGGSRIQGEASILIYSYFPPPYKHGSTLEILDGAVIGDSGEAVLALDDLDVYAICGRSSLYGEDPYIDYYIYSGAKVTVDCSGTGDFVSDLTQYAGGGTLVDNCSCDVPP